MTEYASDRARVGAWRRVDGEFSKSGTIQMLGPAHVAWVGQCVEDSGDAADRAIATVSADRPDDAAMAQLNGAFAAFVLVAEPFEVRVCTDRHRHYPVYVHQGATVTVASTEMRCIVPWLDGAKFDQDAVDMLLRCGELIDRQTLLRGVQMLPPGTVLTDNGDGPTDRRYWTMRSDASGSFKATAEALADRLQTSVRRLERVTPRLGITLSGGLDSRIILDLCERPERIPSFTWGLPNCRDIVCASEFASLVQSPHTVRHWQPEAFPPLWSRGVDLTGGSCGIESMFMLPYVPLLASTCDVVLNGLAGDAILGGNWLKHAWLSESNILELGRTVWRWRVAEWEDRLADRLTGRSPGVSSAIERWSQSIASRQGARPIERLNDWFIENRVFRTTNCGTMLLRGGVESHSPFFDRDFVDAIEKTNQDHKFKHRLYLDVMNKIAPRAASVTWQRTNVAPAKGYYANLAAMAFQRVITLASAPLGLTPFKALKVADQGAWIRGPWRHEIEAVILADRFLQRGLVNPDVVREVWQAHLAGSDRTRQIGVLIALELASRQMLDGDTQ